MSHKLYSVASRLSTLNDQQVDQQTPVAEDTEALSKKGREILTPIVGLLYLVDDSKKVRVQDKNLRRDGKDGTPLFCEQVNGTKHKADKMALRVTACENVTGTILHYQFFILITKTSTEQKQFDKC